MRLPRKVDPSRLNVTVCFLRGIIQPAGPLPLYLPSKAVLSIKLGDFQAEKIGKILYYFKTSFTYIFGVHLPVSDCFCVIAKRRRF